jgi:hypothetical protein
MDMQLLIWVMVFVGGYSVVVAWLLGIALRNPGDGGPGESAGGVPGRGDHGDHGTSRPPP